MSKPDNATGSKPESAAGGEWPDFGYQPSVDAETGRAVDGHETTPARVALLPFDEKTGFSFKLWTATREEVSVEQTERGYQAWGPSNNALLLSWEEEVA